jgi:hypothetical protein
LQLNADLQVTESNVVRMTARERVAVITVCCSDMLLRHVVTNVHTHFICIAVTGTSKRPVSVQRTIDAVLMRQLL